VDVPAHTVSVRRCERCGGLLSRYNRGNYCSACENSGDWIIDSGQSGLSDDGPLSIGARLRKARQRRGMTAEVFAGLCGVSPAYISMIENGKRSAGRYSLVVSLAEALHISPAELASGSPSTMAKQVDARPSDASADRVPLRVAADDSVLATDIAQDGDEAVKRRMFLLNMVALLQLGRVKVRTRLRPFGRYLRIPRARSKLWRGTRRRRRLPSCARSLLTMGSPFLCRALPAMKPSR